MAWHEVQLNFLTSPAHTQSCGNVKITDHATMMEKLPLLNALLNGLAAMLLIVGRLLIKQKRIKAHRAVMLGAFVVSCLFLVFYVWHKAWKGGVHTPYHGQGLLAWAYYVMLASHVILAMAVPVLAIMLIVLGLRRHDAQHRRLARWAWPLWLYVSITGVLIYLMLYPLNPIPVG